MDLLEYAQQLVNRGHASHNAHVVHLQELVQEKQPPTEIKPKAEQNSQVPVKDSNNNTFYLVGGLVLFGLVVLAIGYWLGKKKNKSI